MYTVAAVLQWLGKGVSITRQLGVPSCPIASRCKLQTSPDIVDWLCFLTTQGHGHTVGHAQGTQNCHLDCFGVPQYLQCLALMESTLTTESRTQHTGCAHNYAHELLAKDKVSKLETSVAERLVRS